MFSWKNLHTDSILDNNIVSVLNFLSMDSYCDNTGECQVLMRYTLEYIELKRYDFHNLPQNGSGIINITYRCIEQERVRKQM